MLNPGNRRGEYAELAGMFFLQSLAVGMWLVTLTSVLQAHGLASIRSYAYASTALGAFVSPLLFGAMADRHTSPVLVMRWVAVASAGTTVFASWAVGRGWPPGWVLLVIQLNALCIAPSGSLATTIAFSRLKDSQGQFGPVRAAATLGWMSGCWLLSALRADASPAAGYLSAMAWLGLGMCTFLLPRVPPPAQAGPAGLRERLGWDALILLKCPDHRVVLLTTAVYSMTVAGFYPFTPPALQSLGFDRTAAWMSLAQVSEVVAMLGLAGLFRRWRLKWILGTGLGLGVLRYALCAMNRPGWLLAGVFLQGVSFTLCFITTQIYLNERVEAASRARAQGLVWLMNMGLGNLVGYVGCGWWFAACSGPLGVRWPLFWAGLAAANAVVMIYFLWNYRGQGSRARQTP